MPGFSFDVARAAWPEIDLDRDLVERELVARDAGAAPEGYSADLYLACALKLGHPAALTAFETTVMPDVLHLLRRRGFHGAHLADAEQDLRAKLFSGPAALIGEYRGRGALKSWVLVVAIRNAIKLAQRETRERPLDDDQLAELAAPTGDHALDAFRRRCSEEFRVAFTRAVAALATRDRTLLRMTFVHHATIDHIASIYAVHRATAARWVQAAKTALRDRTCAELAHQLDSPAHDIESILRFVGSQLEVSSERLLIEAD